ncbi:MAG: response regulator transcription factor [Deltaproteobacteria bacterium]|jgi:two-component system phosphate regulon response regulator PhoB|nr:response regulator transcription factor [Deltaproteobacteria bacterium]
MQTVLIVEDEEDIRELLALRVKREGFAALEAADGAVALKLAARHRPDIILLDIMLPGQDGLTVCKNLQRSAETAAIPVIMLTARGEEMDRVVGLELGAADYVVKPFSVREVILRIRAVLRRTRPPSENLTLHCGSVRMDLAEHSVSVAASPVVLTLTEFRLLEDLLRHRGKARSREQLLDSVWGYSFEGYARTVDTHVRRLRGKLGAASGCIETIRGVGYKAREEESC